MSSEFLALWLGLTLYTAAFIAAYDFVLAQMDSVTWSSGGPHQEQSYIIWIPHGSYLISDTIVYSGEPRIGEAENKKKILKNKPEAQVRSIMKNEKHPSLIWMNLKSSWISV